ncbi:MAG: hypothetical protein ACYDG2_23865 [Ruminiclostridium sp.]
MDSINIVIILVFIIMVVLIALILSKHSIEIQAIVLTILGVIAFIGDRLMLHYFHEYFVKQWYYLNITKITGSNRESIIVPFILIGMIVYWITQKLVLKLKH